MIDYTIESIDYSPFLTNRRLYWEHI